MHIKLIHSFPPNQTQLHTSIEITFLLLANVRQQSTNTQYPLYELVIEALKMKQILANVKAFNLFFTNFHPPKWNCIFLIIETGTN